MPAGYSGTPLARKLGLKPGMRVRLLDAPDHYWELFDDGVRELDLEILQASGPSTDGVADFTHLFAADRETLRTHFSRAREGMAEAGVVWASWPKKSSSLASEIDKAAVLREGKAVGLVDVKVAAIDETWSGHKFVIPVADRRGG